MMSRRRSLPLALVLLGACASPPVKTAEPPPLPPAPPPAVERRLPELPVTQMEEEITKVEPRKLYTLAVRDADVREVLLTLGKKTDLNIVFGPDVKGAVTVDLKRVTLEEALNSLLGPIGLEYAREGNFIRVFIPALETRIFTLSYISTTRTGGATLTATAGGGGGGTTTGTAAGGGGGGGAGASSSVTSADSVDLWGDLEKNLTGLISKDGRAVVNRAAGIIAVTDFRRNIQRIARYIELIEGSVQRQVIIEAQIVEVTLTKEFQAGINWSLIPQPGAFSLRPFGVGSVQGTVDAAGSLAATALAPATTVFQLGFIAQAFGHSIRALLNALSKQGEVNILSTPRISTLNNQKAVIKVATDDVFFTTTKTREPTTGVETTTVTPQTITEGLVLDVTPQIAEDNTVMMNIRPSISERVGQATSPDGSTVPIVSVRATDTVVRAQDGQTVVIGGLMQQRKSSTTTGVPGLEKAPIFGSLFRQKVEEGRKTELVILLTPRVVIGRKASDLSQRELELLREAGGARALRR